MSDETKPFDQENHTAAVQGLFIKYQPVTRSYILSMAPDFALADDILQETFLVVSKKASDFKQGTSFTAWVKTIARFKTFEALRRERGRFTSLSEETLEALSAEPHEYASASEMDNRIDLLKGCINELTPQARRSITLRYFGEHLPPQIARLMGCTIQSANVTLSRARAFLRQCVHRKLALKSH